MQFYSLVLPFIFFSVGFTMNERCFFNIDCASNQVCEGAQLPYSSTQPIGPGTCQPFKKIIQPCLRNENCQSNICKGGKPSTGPLVLNRYGKCKLK
jgi:hypothetical protein